MAVGFNLPWELNSEREGGREKERDVPMLTTITLFLWRGIQSESLLVTLIITKSSADRELD